MITEEGQRLFLPRSPRSDDEKVAKAITALTRDKTLEVVEGTVIVTRRGTERKITKLGVIPGPKESAGKDLIFQAPPTFSPSQLAMAALFDSKEKCDWRKLLGDTFDDQFGGVEQIDPNDKHILLFPGLGQEVELWKSKGFREDQMIFVERDKSLAEELADKYPGAKIIARKFEARASTTAKEINEHLGPEGRLSVLSIDPNNHLSKTFRYAVMDFIGRVQLNDRCFVSLCFSGGRRDNREDLAMMVQNKKGRTYQQWLETSLHELRTTAVKHALEHVIDRSWRFKKDKDHKARLIHNNAYRGDGTTPMYYAMSMLEKPEI
ncbi:hypothetical protein HOE67_02475 [Candidatus Peregrinibacteria bacterium]|nr:hypothetical protein [Candidatus Peregrinibacteria bacterium]